MSSELISILVLVAVFLVATVLPVNMGALALVAAFVVGAYVAGEEIPDDVLGGFPAELFLILVGVTYLFAIAKLNGTVDWLVQSAVRLVRGRVALIPWVMFIVISLLTAFGAVVPAAVAIIAPIGLSFAKKHGISPVLMSLLIINGASAGGFAPNSVFGSITNGVVEESGLPGSPLGLFAASYVINFLLSVAVFFLFGGKALLSRRAEDADVDMMLEQSPQEVLAGPGGRPTASSISSGIGTGQPGAVYRREDGAGGAGGPGTTGAGSGAVGASSGAVGAGGPAAGGDEKHLKLNRSRIITLISIVGTAVAAFVFDLDIGVVAITAAVILSLFSPEASKSAVGQIAWPTVLLITGIVTYVALMRRMGTIDYLGETVADIGTPLVAALVICLIGAAVSAFASTTGILAALIPLAVPFLLAGEIGAVGVIIALALSSSIVDSSPFSTSGALCVANSPEDQRDYVYRTLLRWGLSMILVAPLLTWLIFVVPGWL